MSGSKTAVHLQNGILYSRKKEGTPILHDSMDGTGEHYTKWDKPGGERQIPYNLTYKRNLINKTNKWAKQNQRLGNKKQSDSDQRGTGRGTTGERRGRDKQWDTNRGLMGIDNGGDWLGEWGGRGWGEQGGKRWDNYNWTMINLKNIHI